MDQTQEEFMAEFEEAALAQALAEQRRYGVAARQANPVPLVESDGVSIGTRIHEEWERQEQERDTEVSDRYFNRQEALRIAFENVKGDWQEAMRAAREILVFLQEA